MSQKNEVLDFMKRFGSITPAQAYEEIGCMRLAARIADLKEDVYTIRTEQINRRNVYGRRIKFARYSIEQ